MQVQMVFVSGIQLQILVNLKNVQMFKMELMMHAKMLMLVLHSVLPMEQIVFHLLLALVMLKLDVTLEMRVIAYSV